ncbi:MAG: circularly permuted type 2 ATP-grasp protein, partial [Microbacteriaceae bacterium]|nr:circularly permuted type 2 ATP-grasp protein [Microbacteriaceae bacterium]
MADLFDGYRDARARLDSAAFTVPYDEMFGHGAVPLAARAPYADLHAALADLTHEQIRHRSEQLAESYLAQGVTFD